MKGPVLLMFFHRATRSGQAAWTAAATFYALFNLVLIPSSASASEEVLFFRPKGTGVSDELVDAVSIVFRTALDAEGDYISVSSFELLGDVECHDIPCAAELAGRAGLRKAVISSVTRLGSKILVAAQLVESRSGRVAAAADGTALSEEDLDVVIKRMARAISTGRTVEETAELGLITEDESSVPLRRGSFTSQGLRIGFIWPSGDSMGKVDRLTVLDFVYQYESLDYFLAGRSGFRWGGGLDAKGYEAMNVAFLDARVGRYLDRSDFSPFISAGFGLHWIKITQSPMQDDMADDKSDSGTGFSLSIGTGFTAMRTYDFQFQMDLDYFIVLEKLGTEYVDPDYPRGIMLTFCIKKGDREDGHGE